MEYQSAFCDMRTPSGTYVMLVILLFLLPHTALRAKTTPLLYENRVYEDNIKTVLLYPADGPSNASMAPAAIPITHPAPLVLRFDEVQTEDQNHYMARILACDAQWQPARINEMEYIDEYNEFHIDNYAFSMATKVPFTHYQFSLPRVRLPGNYLLVVYRNYDEKDLVLSRRFLVFDQRIMIKTDLAMSNGVAERRENHQINFAIDYSGLDVPNPYLDLKVVVRQNRRWDNAIFGLRPSMVREDISQLVYRNVNFENNFKAGNEFRFFDLRSLRYSGQNIEKIMMGDFGSDAFLYIDQPRGSQPYAHLDDMNGGFLIENRESPDAHLESDYARVHFFLELQPPLEQSIYVAGALTDWKYDEQNEMQYLESSGVYTCNLWLKQGLYNYCYILPDAEENPNMIEGNFFQTQNTYQIIVYFRHPMLNTDIIAGYAVF
jgi:hypothetical protein